MSIQSLISAMCCVIILVVFTAPEAQSQPHNRGVITGTIKDSSDGQPVENAVIFIPHSGIGTSSGRDGRFALPALPGGDYKIIVSRVGYFRTQLQLTVDDADSLRLNIFMTARPVQTSGIDIEGEAVPGPVGPPVFFPKGGERSWCAYGSETEIPVGILFTEKAMYMFALDTTLFGGEKYIRLWLLIYNGSTDTLVFDAKRDIRLNITGGKKIYENVRTDPAWFDTIALSGMAARNFRPRAVERTLKVMSTQSTLFIDEAFRFDLQASGTMGYPPIPFLGWLNPTEHPAGVNPRFLKTIYDKCAHGGVLGRYRIFPESGVDGFMVFPLPGFQQPAKPETGGREFTFVYEFIISTPSGDERISFTAH